MANKKHLWEYLRDYCRAKQGYWINGGELEDYARTIVRKNNRGYKASNCDRRLREISEFITDDPSDIIPLWKKEMTVNGVRSMWYMAKPPKSYSTATLGDGQIIKIPVW